MPSQLSAELKGLKETQRNLEKAVQDLRGTPMLNAMRDATLMVERDAKKGLVGYQSPSVGGVNTGILRASITPEVRNIGETIEGVVGSNKEYAPYVEDDTRPHWVPKGILADWAKKHHIKESVVRWAIAQRGTKGKHFLEKGFTLNKDKIEARFNKAVDQITKDANK